MFYLYYLTRSALLNPVSQPTLLKICNKMNLSSSFDVFKEVFKMTCSSILNI